MRRYLASAFHPVTRRTGVTASVTASIRSVQSPVSISSSRIGFAPSVSRQNFHATYASGIRHTMNTNAFPRSARRFPRSSTLIPPLPASRVPLPSSEILPQVHAGVQARDLVRVAVEHERFLTTEHTDAPLAGLGPARVIDLRIHVRVETVLVG